MLNISPQSASFTLSDFLLADKPSPQACGTILDTIEFAISSAPIAPEGGCSLTEWFEMLLQQIALLSYFLLLDTFPYLPCPLTVAWIQVNTNFQGTQGAHAFRSSLKGP